ncbi:MAG: GspH/FimT family pseudopilin [Chromatiaceae bacterium]|nr:GspH/FimT family pseudopilin [Chromatiaceae bacterium]MCP5434021.1 GspH/FimT family pseudopilin [Chromatiaceae bacterium]MCW5586380.1 GspH/FimT family pseudopilin [Chromatiales bacterium]
MNIRQTGLTLIELMVTLAVAIVLLAVGVPLFTGLAGSNRATTQANTFLAAFKLARSEAISQGSEVSICSVADVEADPVECGDENDWGNGLLVFTDSGTLGSVDGGDTRIRVFANPSDGAIVDTSNAYVRFNAQGDASDLVNHSLCPDSGTPVERTCMQLNQTESTGNLPRCLHIRRSGQIRLERGTCS